MRNKELFAAIGTAILFIVAVCTALGNELGFAGLALGLAFLGAGEAAAAHSLADREADEEAKANAERLRAADARSAARRERYAADQAGREGSSD